MQELGKILIALGIGLVFIGIFLWKLASRVPLGRLPGDIFVHKSNFTFYFPLTTCILVSLFLSLLFWLFRR